MHPWIQKNPSAQGTLLAPPPWAYISKPQTFSIAKWNADAVSRREKLEDLKEAKEKNRDMPRAIHKERKGRRRKERERRRELSFFSASKFGLSSLFSVA
jgi:hypothetical protein